MNIGFLLGMSLLLLPSMSVASHAECCCTIRLTAQLVQDILDAINFIRPTVTSIQITVNEINETLASCCANLSSQIDNITVNVSVSGLDQVITAIDSIVASCCAELSSQIDNITVNVSVSGLDQIITRLDIIEGELLTCCEEINSRLDIITSQIDNITVNVQISGLDQLTTCCDALTSRIGNLSDLGTCLESLIDVPEDINNLNLTVIQLLKTILLELRGCSPC